MSASLQRLSFVVSLLDNVTGPVGKINKALSNTAASARSAFADIGSGALGIAGAGFAIKSLLDPAIEMDRALGEVRSLGVAESALSDLSKTAMAFSVQYGKSATEFVSASYDIQSAIAGLSGAELGEFTKNAGVLAAATKSNTATITSYMGTMYGVFKNTADAMGKNNWVKVLSGQTASAVQMFKTTGDQMSAAFTSIGANATSAGIAMNEQMAILGTLQSTMSGSEAGTKYKSFLTGVGNAQKALGLQFTDSEGNMLGMVNILEQLKGKFGETFDVAESDALKKAFGSDEAVGLIKQLMADTGGLAKSINDLGKVKGMEKAEEMAKAMVDPWQQLSAGIFAVSASFGKALLPVITPMVEKMAAMAATITRWTDLFPELTKWVGVAVVSIIGMTAALAAITLISGLSKSALLVWSGATWTAKTISTNFIAALKWLRGAILGQYLALQMSTTATKISAFATAAWAGAVSMATGVVSVVTGVLRGFRTVMIAVNAAMLANPIGLIIAGIALLVAAVGACIYWWDDLKAAFLDTAWGQGLMNLIGDLMDWFKNLQGIAGTAVSWVVDKLNMIPGVNIGTESSNTEVGTVNRELKTASVTPGGVTNHISKTLSNSSNRNNNVTINTTQAPTQHLMDSWMTMEAF
ncbi:phage tail tape measure protein [Endozoicomonas sp. YOMI1]|uniref:phage tail tape measure protein n=1 Tax=Endozoicomonas sp. YOMI1 TaxID=2828739 RepID=UPI002148C6AA|nr:phage tail tape measure protein [Endozoicomonas sp. YOMI1]